MGGSSGGQTSSVGPPSWQLPYIKQGMQGAQNMYQQGGTPVVPFSNETEQALQRTAGRATGGSPGVTAAQNINTQTINGGFLGSNPYLDQTFNRAALATQNQLASQFAGSGRDVGASEGLRSQQLNDLATGIYGGAYDSERNRQQQAIGMASGLANQDYVDLGQLASVGAQREGLSREQAEQPGLALDQYLGRVTGNVGQSSYQPRNTAAGAIGGAMLGSQFGSQMGWGGLGQVGSGLLGGYLGGWG
jgi:hypothetical protein